MACWLVYGGFVGVGVSGDFCIDDFKQPIFGLRVIPSIDKSET